MLVKLRCVRSEGADGLLEDEADVHVECWGLLKFEFKESHANFWYIQN